MVLLEHSIIQMTATASLTVPHSIAWSKMSIFTEKSFFSDEAHFHIGGYVNKQNCRSWGSQNPNVIIEKSMHPKWVTGADFGTVALLGHFSSKMSKEPPLLSMASNTVPWSTNFCFQKLKRMTWTTFVFNTTGPLAIQPT